MENKKTKKIDYRFIIIGILILAGVIIYFYKNYQLKHQREELVEKADSVIISQNNQLLYLTAKPLVWALRGEMLRNNLDEINILTSDLVKTKSIQDINLLNKDGLIINSTNKKLEGTFAASDYKNYLVLDTAQVIHTSDSVARLITPIMGYQSKLGVVVINYKISKFKP